MPKTFRDDDSDVGSKSLKHLKSVENLSETSSGFRSTSSSRFSARVNKLLSSRSYMTNVRNEGPKELASNLAREILKKYQEEETLSQHDSLEIYDNENGSYPIQGIRDEDKENKKKHTKQVSTNVEYNDIDDVVFKSEDLKNESISSSEDGFLNITDGQVSVDLDELLAGVQDDKVNNEGVDLNELHTDVQNNDKINTEQQHLSQEHKHDFTADETDGDGVNLSTNVFSEAVQRGEEIKGSWFPENMVENAIKKLASDIVSKCDGVDLVTASNIAQHMPYCGGEGGNTSSIAPDMMDLSTISAVRISNEEIPPTDQNQQEGFEVEYIPTELVDSISEKHDNDAAKSILMHFNSANSGSLPLPSREPFFDLSMNDSSIVQNTDASSELAQADVIQGNIK